ncbi:MazG family protein [Bacillus horti]|nr:MazG family protein [Bacillus horti]
MYSIHVLGLGAGDLQQMTLGVYKEIQQAKQLYLRTKEHPVVQELEEQGLQYQAFDAIYEQHEQFEQVYQHITDALFAAVKQHHVIHYAVPGHPLVAEKTVQLLLEQAAHQQCQINILGGQSFLDPLLASIQVDPVEGLGFHDALRLQAHHLQPQQHTVITQVYDSYVASEVKLTLMDIFPDEHPITVVQAAGSSQEKLLSIPLYELDRITLLSNLTALYVPPTQEPEAVNRQYYRSREIFRQLRGPDGCPWDKEQTHQSLTKYLLEEASEVVQAIEEGDIDHLVEELGDVLLQVFLHAQIGEDEGLFNMEDVIQSLNDKMIRRHPHVFGQKKLEQAEDVIEQWERIKREEQQGK